VALRWHVQTDSMFGYDDTGARVALVQRQGRSWRAVLVGLGLFGTDLGTHDSLEMAMQVAEDRWDGRA
jgi:hypothetical protein